MPWGLKGWVDLKYPNSLLLCSTSLFSNLAYALQCFTGQNVLHQTRSDDSALPVELKNCSSGQGCGTATYQFSFIDSTFRRQSASIVQGICANYDVCRRSSDFCRVVKNELGFQFTINSCQVNFSLKVNWSTNA